jgi:hypothetical protein
MKKNTTVTRAKKQSRDNFTEKLKEKLKETEKLKEQEFSIDCDWRLFSSTAKECVECDDFAMCKRQRIDAMKPLSYFGLTQGVIEDDAKEYAEFIREMDKMELAMWREEATIESMDQRPDDEAVIETTQYKSKGYRTLHSVMKFLDDENVPYVYSPPNDLFVANFMMVSHTTYGVSLRLTGTKGIPSGVKFKTKAYKAKGRNYKYAKSDEAEVIFAILKSIVRYRKRYDK